MPRNKAKRTSRERPQREMAQVVYLRVTRTPRAADVPAEGATVHVVAFGAKRRSERVERPMPKPERLGWTHRDIQAVREWDERHPAEAAPSGWESA